MELPCTRLMNEQGRRMYRRKDKKAKEWAHMKNRRSGKGGVHGVV